MTQEQLNRANELSSLTFGDNATINQLKKEIEDSNNVDRESSYYRHVRIGGVYIDTDTVAKAYQILIDALQERINEAEAELAAI